MTSKYNVIFSHSVYYLKGYRLGMCIIAKIWYNLDVWYIVSKYVTYLHNLFLQSSKCCWLVLMNHVLHARLKTQDSRCFIFYMKCSYKWHEIRHYYTLTKWRENLATTLHVEEALRQFIATIELPTSGRTKRDPCKQ